jgi:hypothetical protein
MIPLAGAAVVLETVMDPDDPDVLSLPRPVQGDTWTLEERLLLVYLQNREDHCPLCGYNVHRLTVPRCPECGQELALSVIARGLKLRCFILAIVALAASAGVGLLLLLLVIANLLQGFGMPGGLFSQAGETLVVTSFWGTIPAAVALVVARRRFLRLSARAQTLIATAAVAFFVAQIAAFVVWVR